MAASNSKIQSNLGFLTIVHDPTEARIGGLLLVNASGRPLEFHCTAPVKPNRAQEILYGPTLGEYLCGEQIGMALSEALKYQPTLLLADIPETLSLRPLIEFPLLLLATEQNHAGSLGQSFVQMTHNDQTLVAREEYAADLRVAESALQTLSSGLDLCEPFGRIREAIAEAQGGMRKSTAA